MKISPEFKNTRPLVSKIRSQWLSAVAATAVLGAPVSLFAASDPGQQAVIDALHSLYGSSTTLTGVTATQLENAVSKAVSDALANNTGVAPALIAAGALEPDPTNNQIRSDMSDIASGIVTSAISGLGNASNINQRVANIAAAVINVNSANPADALPLDGQTSAAGAALAAQPGAAQAIGIQTGQVIKAKAAFTRDALSDFLSTAGVNLSTAPYVAQGFVNGILATGLPPSISAVDFASKAVSDISTYSDVVARVGNAIAVYVGSSSPNLAPVAQALINSAPSATAQITQGVAATLPITGPFDGGRGNFAGQLVSLVPGQAQSIAVGMAALDPNAADVFTFDIVSSLTHNPNTVSQVPGIASAVAEVIPADEACHISNWLGLLMRVPNPTLPFTTAPQIAGAIAGISKVVTQQSEMQEVASSMAFQLAKLYTPSTSAAVAQQIITAVANVSAQVVLQNVQYVNNNPGSPFFGDKVAGSVAEVFGAVKNSALQNYILQQIINYTEVLIDGSGSPDATSDKQKVVAAVNSVKSGASFPVGCLEPQETPVTNF